MWKTYLGQPAGDWYRCGALQTLSAALVDNDPEAGLPVLEAHLAEFLRFWPDETIEILGARGNLALCYSRVERHGEALRLNREVYSGFEDMLGPNHVSTIINGNNLLDSLLHSDLFDECKWLARKLLRGAKHNSLGENHVQTVMTKYHLGRALFYDPTRSHEDIVEAEEVLADACKTQRRLVGAHHPNVRIFEAQLERVRKALAEYQP